MDSESEIIHLTEAECREGLEESLALVGMTYEEYLEYVADKCHPKCWCPDDAPRGAWHAIDTWEFLLGIGRHASGDSA